MPKNIPVDANVSVELPDTLKHLDAKTKPEKGLPPPKGRLVSNFMIFDPEDPETELMDFPEPFELRVRYTPADKKNADDEKKPLQIQYNAGKGWKRLKTRLEPNASGKGGIGIAKVTKWDPQIGWFP